MLPGDFVAMRLTGEIKTTVSGLSEGIFWNFRQQQVAKSLLDYYEIDQNMLPDAFPVFSEQGTLTQKAAQELGLSTNTKVTYRAGDQPNNAFSLNVLNPGEVAATAGTSGVVYGINDQPGYDPASRVNTFVHVNHTPELVRYGVLLCLNGTGILNSWLKNQAAGASVSYQQMNDLAANVPVGSDGLFILPFGNGAERILENKDLGATVTGLDFNRHQQGHLFRAAQEGIVFALNYGLEIMREMGMKIETVRAGYTNMFLSPLFREAFANTTGTLVELYNTDGSQGAARGAGLGAGIYSNASEAFRGLKTIEHISPTPKLTSQYKDAYRQWLEKLNNQIQTI
jgi:xylulokinase